MSKQHLNEVLSDPSRRESLERRFRAKVKQGDPTECWPWVAKATARYGYGRMTAGRGRYLRAHQVAWALVNGPLPESISILHSCDNTACCNPAHLSPGTALDNVKDAQSRGRFRKPPIHSREKHPNVRITAADAAAIATDKRAAHLVAADYGICTMTVYRHRKGLTWK